MIRDKFISTEMSQTSNYSLHTIQYRKQNFYSHIHICKWEHSTTKALWSVFRR